MNGLIDLRPARAEDLEFCERLYFAAMDRVIEELALDRAKHALGFRRQWNATEVQLILLNGAEVGWLQTHSTEDDLFLSQLFIGAEYQGRAIGTAVMGRLIAAATAAHQTVSLAVLKGNPAIRLYERLGFRVIREDERKLYMRRPNALPVAGPPPFAR